MPYIITEACIGVKDRACVDVCPVDCIYEGEDQLYIHPDECIDCGACEPECPVSAIYPEEDVPENLQSFIAKNKEVFDFGHAAGKAQQVVMARGWHRRSNAVLFRQADLTTRLVKEDRPSGRGAEPRSRRASLRKASL